MSIDDTLNTIAGWIAFAVAIPSHLLVLIYGFGSPWWRSVLGVSLFAKWLSVALAFDYIISRRLFDEYPGYGLAGLLAYGFVLVAFTATVVELVIERRSSSLVPLAGRMRGMTDSKSKTPSTIVRVVDGLPTTVDPATGDATGKPTAKVAAGIITAGALVVVEAAITAITPDLFSGLGPWGAVVFAGVVGLGGFIAGYIKRP